MFEKINWKKVFTVGGIVATIIGAGFNVAEGFVDLKNETQKKPELPGPSEESK